MSALKNTSDRAAIAILQYTWIVTWILTIWISEYRAKLFLTGLFSLILALLWYHGAEKNE